jgi:hypothetical protein
MVFDYALCGMGIVNGTKSGLIISRLKSMHVIKERHGFFVKDPVKIFLRMNRE